MLNQLRSSENNLLQLKPLLTVPIMPLPAHFIPDGFV